MIAATIQRDIIRCSRARLPEALPLRSNSLDHFFIGEERVLPIMKAQATQFSFNLFVILLGVRFPTLGLRSYWFDEALYDDDRFGGGFGLGSRGAAASDQGSGVLLKLAKGFFCVGSSLGLDIGRNRRGRRRYSVFMSCDFVSGRGFRGTLRFCGSWTRVFVIFVVGEAEEFGNLRLLGFGGRRGSGREDGGIAVFVVGFGVTAATAAEVARFGGGHVGERGFRWRQRLK
ncbi:hypothetical protein V8G54_020464 [Vigna mungo]|uniref:Uncharacterized protein n=1 Tax=Vigna mungo TaxID=3915 RepID=A0AAQ3NFJ7_VIGMU